MNESKKMAALKYVLAERISTGDDPDPAQEEQVCITQEAPLSIEVESVETYTLLSTPIDRRAAASRVGSVRLWMPSPAKSAAEAVVKRLKRSGPTRSR